MMSLEDSFLAGTAAGGARHLALRQVEAAKEALARMDDPADAEALHDFRVSLRRLRSILRAYRSRVKDTVSKRMLRRLKRIAGATGAGRDAEVQAACLAGWEKRVPRESRSGAVRFRERIEARRDEAYSRGVAESCGAFIELEPLLRSALESPLVLPAGPSSAGGRSFFVETADLIDGAARGLLERLSAIRSHEDKKRCHSARIQGKRLRYLVEPLKTRSRAWERCLESLKGLQDILGELHDMHVLAEELSRTAEESAVEDVRSLFRNAVFASGRIRSGGADLRKTLSGLLHLARQAHYQETALFSRLRRRWGEVRRARFFGEMAALAAGLRRHSRPRAKGLENAPRGPAKISKARAPLSPGS